MGMIPFFVKRKKKGKEKNIKRIKQRSLNKKKLSQRE